LLIEFLVSTSQYKLLPFDWGSNFSNKAFSEYYLFCHFVYQLIFSECYMFFHFVYQLIFRYLHGLSLQVVVAYNPLGWERSDFIRVPVSDWKLHSTFPQKFRIAIKRILYQGTWPFYKGPKFVNILG
jgi:hypothetical protein